MSTSACAIGPNLVEEVLLLHPSTTRAEDGYAWLLEPLTSHMTSTGSNQSRIRIYSLKFNSSSGKFSKTSFSREITSKEERYYQTPSASDADPKKQHSIYFSIVILLNKSGDTPVLRIWCWQWYLLWLGTAVVLASHKSTSWKYLSLYFQRNGEWDN